MRVIAREQISGRTFEKFRLIRHSGNSSIGHRRCPYSQCVDIHCQIRALFAMHR